MQDLQSVQGRRLIVALLILAHCAIDLLAFSSSEIIHDGEIHSEVHLYTSSLGLPLVLSQMCLLIVWGILGKNKTAYRVACSLTGVLVAASTAHRSGEWLSDWQASFLGVTILFAGALRIAGLRLLLKNDETSQQRNLTLGNLFELTTWIAIAAAVLRRVPGQLWVSDGAIFVGIAASAQGLSAMYFVLGCSWLPVRIFVCSLVLLLACGIADFVIPGWMGVYFYSSLVQIGVILASSVVLSNCGYRIERPVGAASPRGTSSLKEVN